MQFALKTQKQNVLHRRDALPPSTAHVLLSYIIKL